jgi:peptidoglycan hydrolase-like protein with peptidoglycan-binding domain
MFRQLVFALVMALVPTVLHADETVLATQKKLTQLGFYKGEVDGQPGSQTSAAIRRYQIAKNLKVTGELNRQTLDQLGINASTPAPAYVAIADIFKGGPYISSGPDKQVAVIRQAQKNLKLLKYYNGPEDGLPNAALVSALKAWQKSAGFRQSGRFDENSLKGLDLMPN